MRILIVGSCGKKKLTASEQAPHRVDLESKNDLVTWQKKLGSLVNPAREMYIGNQNRELVRGVDILRTINNIDVVLKIISAGFGLLDENERIPPYECSFSGMRKSQIIDRSKKLEIGTDFNQLCGTGFDLIYLALGTDYSIALGDEWKQTAQTTVVGFGSSLFGEKMVRIPSGHEIVHAFSMRGHKIHGITGFKGDLLRVLATHAHDCKDPYHELLRWTYPTYLRDLILHLSGLSTLH